MRRWDADCSSRLPCAIDPRRPKKARATVLLDAHDPLRHGGTGQLIDWTVAATIARRRPVILSGGLTPETVDAAVRAVRPYAIDVSSGVESSPGRKDPTKLRAFFAALRAL